MKAIRWSLPRSITPLSRTSVSPLPPALCGRKTSASRRSYRTRSGRQCWIPCIRITSTPSATRGLPTTTMPPPSSILSVPGIARTPVGTATPAYDAALRNAAKASDVATRGKYYQQAEDLAGAGCSRHSGLSLCTYPSGETLGRGFTPDKLGYYYTKDMYIKKQPIRQRRWALIFLCKLPEIQTNNTKLFVFKAVDQNDALQHPSRCL